MYTYGMFINQSKIWLEEIIKPSSRAQNSWHDKNIWVGSSSNMQAHKQYMAPHVDSDLQNFLPYDDIDGKLKSRDK